MADKQVSELTAAATLTGSELTHVVQSSNSRRTTLTAIANLAQSYTNSAIANAIAIVNATLLAMQQRGSVRVKTTGAVTISTALVTGQVIDGVTLASLDLVLVAQQVAPAENGIYSVSGTPSRSSEYNAYNEHPGTIIVVEEGVTQSDTIWYCTSNRGGTLGTTAIQYSAIGTGGGGAGTGGTTSVELCMFAGGRLLANEVLLRHEFTAATILPLDLAGSQGSAGVAPTLESYFYLKKNTSNIGTVSWVAASTEPTFQLAAPVAFAVGNVFSVVNVATIDATLADVSLSIVGEY